MSEWMDKIENDEAKAKFDAVDQELVNIAVALYQHEIEPNIPDLLLGCDENDMIDCNDALFDHACQYISDDDKTLTYEEIHFIAKDIANRYFPTED